LILGLSTLLLLFSYAPAAVAAAPGVGSYAPPVDLSDLDGGPRNIAWGEGSPSATIVYFFDPLYSGCLLEMSFLDALYSSGHDFGLAVYAIEAKGRQPAEVSRSLERYCRIYRNPAFPILADPAFRAGRTYGAERVPVAFIMESHGVILNRVEGYALSDAVVIARRVEQLLRREKGFFSPVLRESGISEEEEKEIESRLAAASAARANTAATRSLGVGDHAPEFEFTGVAGSGGRWSWSNDAARVMRIVAFFGGLTLDSVAELSWLDALARRGHEAGLEVLAVESSGMDAPAVQALLEKYRRYNPEPSFPVVPDAGGKLARAFGPWDKLPQTYLLAGNGTVLYHAEGFSAGEAEIMSGKTERAFLLAGKPFPTARSDGATAAPAAIEEEAPSIRKRQDQDDRYRSAIVQADAAFMAWEFDRALTNYLAALAVQPKDLHALVRTAQIYERRGETGPALEYWQRVLGVRPDHAEAAGRVGELRQNR
jgi:tetratricopeptide (TPR) repeat protein